MINRYGIVATIASLILLVSCKSSDNDNGTSVTDNPNAACNEWIASTMRSNYLWNSEIPADSKLDYTAAPNTFFYTLLSQNDGKHSNGSNYYYSYIESNKDYTASKAINDDTNSYGIDFVRYSLTDNSGNTLTYEYDRVMYVLPGSSAAQAGLVRGDWILKIDDSNITKSTGDYQKLISGSQRTLTVLHSLHVDDSKTVTITLPASTAVTSNPIFYSNTYTVGSKKVGYLVYNQFAMGPHNSTTDHTYDKELIALFNSKFKDVDEFVLDLRYNPGGYLVSSLLLSRLLLPSSIDESSTFAILTDNKGGKTSYNFNDANGKLKYDLAGYTRTKITRLYVIATSATASASEALMNGLAPYMTVTKIGITTEGKNVGSVNFDADDKYAWDIQPITFSITSKSGNVYNTGLTPDYRVNELDSLKASNFLPLGDTKECLLNKALSLINGGKYSAKVTTRKEQVTTNGLQPVANGLKPTAFGIVAPHKTFGLIDTPDKK